MALAAFGNTPALRRRVISWAARVSLGNKLAYGLTAAALAAGLATYLVMTNSQSLYLRSTQAAFWLLNLDLVLLLILGMVVARRMVSLWSSRKRGLTGARLQGRIVMVFGALAAIPAILTAIFSALFFYVGIQSWFSSHVTTAVDESLAIAQAYLHEHQQAIRADALAMAGDLNREAPWLIGNSPALGREVRTQALMRNLNEALVIDGNGRMLAKSGFALALEFDPADETEIDRARNGEVLILTTQGDNKVRALMRLDRFIDTFLYVERRIEPTVLSQINAAQNAVVEYKMLAGRSREVQIKLTVIFLIIALLTLMAAVWLGIMFANYLVRPIAALIDVAEQVRMGDLTVRVPESSTEDELATLSRAFNRMTSQLDTQRRELVDANQQLDLRRQFTETVLSGVSAGVVGLDVEGRITIANISAAELLGVSVENLTGAYLSEFIPEVTSLLATVDPRNSRLAQTHINLSRPGMPERNFLLRVTAEFLGEAIRGFVATFDDLTDLMSAQRKAAWADVARRIAHEIKNPLTPIQLSAERLRRKYASQITTDSEIFIACTDTIIRHVEDIGRMVDEFSSFARMPQPVMKIESLTDLCRQLLSLRSEAYPDIRFDLVAPLGIVRAECDGRLIGQAVTNLLQNAIEAIQGRSAGDQATTGEVIVSVDTDGQGMTAIAVEDNGIGLPIAERARLAEPYVTTRAKGTGLGLAIVKKIMEDHEGYLSLEDRHSSGTRVSLIFPLRHGVTS